MLRLLLALSLFLLLLMTEISMASVTVLSVPKKVLKAPEGQTESTAERSADQESQCRFRILAWGNYFMGTVRALMDYADVERELYYLTRALGPMWEVERLCSTVRSMSDNYDQWKHYAKLVKFVVDTCNDCSY